MTVPTVPVTCTASDQNGPAVAGALYTARLNTTEIYQGFVVPEIIRGTANEFGVCILNLWPNALGVAGSLYDITATNPDTGKRFLKNTVAVPNAPCNLHQILVQEPYPTLDASAQAVIAAQAALASTQAQAVLADDDRVAAEIAAAQALTRSAASALSEYNAALAKAAAEGSALTAKHIYPGTYAADPLTRPDGSARQVGDSAFIGGLERRWNGTIFQASDISTANLAAPGGAALVGGINPIYVVKNYQLQGDSDSAVINKALRKIELDALPGSCLQFECGRTYSYDSTHSLGNINDLDIDLNGALLKRANASVVSTTLANPLATSGSAGLTLVLTSIPANWQVGDLICAVNGMTTALTSNVVRILTINQGTKTVTTNDLMTLAGVTTHPAGTTIMKSFSCFAGRPSVADSQATLTPGANKRIRIRGGTIDGNTANQISNSWRVNSEILLHSEGGAIYDMKFQNTASECIVGHGVTVRGNTFVDLGGSALHTSVNDFLVAVATPTIFTGNVVRRTNLKGQLASGHAEGAITFSWGPGHLIISNNLFDGGNEPLLGNFGAATGANASRLLIVSGNICKGYMRLFAAVQVATYGVTITGNAFHDCGDNTALTTSTLYDRQNRISGNSLSGNTLLPEQDLVLAQRFGPVVVEKVGGTGPALARGARNMLWVRQGLSEVAAADLFEATAVLEGGNNNNVLSFAGVATQYAGIHFHFAGLGATPRAYLIHDPVTARMTVGSNQAGGSVLLKTGSFADHLSLQSDGASVFSNRPMPVYFGNPFTSGSWRIDASGTDLLFQRLIAGTGWVTKQTIVG